MRENNLYSRYYYTLSFDFDFKNVKSCFFAYSYPYTYTDLNLDLGEILKDPNRSRNITRDTLCVTLGSKKVDVLTVTEKGSPEEV